MVSEEVLLGLKVSKEVYALVRGR